TMEMLKSETVSYSNIYENGESVTEIMVPTKVSGIFVRYLLSNRSLSSKMSDVYTRIAYVSIILFVFTVLMGILFSVTITKPIIFLTKVVEQIRKGDFDAKVTVTSRDEIGRLGLAFNDMTDRLKKSYHEVSDEKARLLASINSLSMGFIIVDSNDAIILHNHSLLKILETETSPQNLIELTKHFSEFDLLDSCRRCIKLNQFVEVRNIPFRKKFLRVFCAPVESVGEIIGHVILMEDVTEARVLERGKEEFFAVASHELRTPLTAIRGNSEMILQMYSDKIVDKDMKDMVSDINIASIRLIDIVNEFLEVSRLEQGRIENKKEEFDMNEVITSSVNAAKAAANKKALSLEYIKPEVELPKVFADKNDTKHVLENLISNSIKFTNEGEITVKAEKENNFIKVSITDTGIGISDFNQPLLFRKFQQAGEKILARDASQGTGLGLYISQILLSNMGGAVKLEKSVLGHGSTFSFTIPVAV
ncbi:MAG: ATP-binding protein, partial [Candidatus Paceibacterota bacterium]